MEETQEQLRQELTELIAEHCEAIKELCHEYNLPLSKITVITRDPANDTLYLVTTNEDYEGLKKACELALQKPIFVVEIESEGGR